MSRRAWIVWKFLEIVAVVVITVVVTKAVIKDSSPSEENSYDPTGERKERVVSDKVMAERKKSIVPGQGYGLAILKDGVFQMTIPVRDVGHTCVDGQEVIIAKTDEKCKE
jgi:hypothetical protein